MGLRFLLTVHLGEQVALEVVRSLLLFVDAVQKSSVGVGKPELLLMEIFKGALDHWVDGWAIGGWWI